MLRIYWWSVCGRGCRGAGARDKLQAVQFKLYVRYWHKELAQLLSDKLTACSTSGFANGDARAPLEAKNRSGARRCARALGP